MKSNVLLVTNLFPTPADPERGVFTLQLAKRLNKICNLTVVCPLPYFPDIFFLKKFKKYQQYSLVPYEYTIDGIKVYSPKYPLIPKLSESRHAYFMSLGLKKCIKKLHKKIAFDTVNSQWLYPDSCAVNIAIKGLNISHVATGLGCDINHDMHETGKKDIIINALETANAITVVSNSLKDELIDAGFSEKKITVIPNGVDISKFNPLPEQECRQLLGIDLKTPVILYVGRLSSEKNIKSLIKTSSVLVQKGYKFNLYIIGDGPLQSELKYLTEKFNISEHVFFMGNIEHEEIIKWMAACNYFCLPSLREGCPNVVLEALSCGRPVIASRVGAIPDIVNENTGVLFIPDDIDSMTTGFEKAFNKTWNEKVISNSVTELSWENAAEKYLNIFDLARENL